MFNLVPTSQSARPRVDSEKYLYWLHRMLSSHGVLCCIIHGGTALWKQLILLWLKCGIRLKLIVHDITHIFCYSREIYKYFVNPFSTSVGDSIWKKGISARKLAVTD